MMTVDSMGYICNGADGGACSSSNSDEDTSPREWNKCKRCVFDKPPLMKRLTMGFLKIHEESKPLMNIEGAVLKEGKSSLQLPLRSGLMAKTTQRFNSYASLMHEDHITSKFGDSCRQSWTNIPNLDMFNIHDRNDYTLKNKYIRKTSSANSSPKIYGNRFYADKFQFIQAHKNDENVYSKTQNTENIELKKASWFQASISEDIAEEILSAKVPGTFVVRKSTSRPGCYALTVRVPSPPGPKTANYIILQTIHGYKIKGFHKQFKTLEALITHHSVMPELLPVPLAMPRPTNIYHSRRLDDFDTYESLKSLFTYLTNNHLEGD